ncbi:MAG: ABC transporter ATP-binding protein [Alphaproteobacteria bacterium]
MRETNGQEPPNAIQLKNINKSFGAVRANANVDLAIKKGTIHGIVGENGAGKSTLMSILYGYYQADSGEILVDGQPTRISTPQDAIAAGIGMVHQHFMLVDNFTVLENVILGAEGGGLLAGAQARARDTLKRLEEDYELYVDPQAVIEDLPVGLQQRVEILKALFRGAEVLILDEPTGVLTPSEADHLFRILRQLRDQGKTIILITHKLREIMSVTDSVSVMRRGALVATVETAKTDEAALAEMMVGRRVLLRVAKEAAKPGDQVLRVTKVGLRDAQGVERLKDITFSLRAGEIVGLAGVAGNGQSQLLAAIAGMKKIDNGEIAIHAHKITPQAPADAATIRDWGVAHVPEDRQHDGLVMPFEEAENLILGYQGKSRYLNGPLLNLSAIRGEADARNRKYDIRPPNCRLKTENFSGGNQQKIVLAREIERDPDVLLVGQPTRGVDIGAIEFIHQRLIDMRDAGKAILLVSVELDEILSLSDRILVMFDGRIVGTCDAATATEQQIGLMMAGAGEAAA